MLQVTIVEEGQEITGAYIFPNNVVAVVPASDAAYSIIHTVGGTYTVKGEAKEIAGKLSNVLLLRS
ncbi:hypothetical protein [Mycobacterium sp. E796]|uniref:hypothetical protein n=1 Tax=Mycobacterium sp. E796 TaxID=1834151 RepID=UPI0007FC9372|nr:hypothetical protein [Mycobacterium sp. E796]OBI60623.1 hypothetical protein A5706_17400 [Mycobacterium sp. E796]